MIVAGTRNYDDYDFFSSAIESCIKKFGSKKIIFISGKARTGADALIIRWCIEKGYPWVEFPADWDRYNKAAGFIRNTEMSEVGTHLVTFFDGKSRGTKHMIDTALNKKMPTFTFLVDVNNTKP